jgi:FixJ family two-component response regulator
VLKAQTISTIDHDASVRVALESLIKPLGFVAFAFEGAEDFLRSPRVDDSSGLITDVQMQGMSGLDLQDRLIAQGSGIPMIFITAFPEQPFEVARRPVAHSVFLKSHSREDCDRVCERGSRGSVTR